MTEFAASRAPRRLFRALRLGNDTAGLVKKNGAGRRQPHHSLRALKKPDAQITLDLLDLLRHGWRRDPEDLRRATEMQKLGHCDEVAELTDIHGGLC
ncbi:hypothetical protein GCM10017643_34530 [Ancylobacter dichloromethanicus]|uniref:Uncharacterized protein n=1 Tax=Ancylobacter dichloromethanicus TaxID=518825 RepID=A0A9W6J9E5_9HYPH|nr:hypothetical protein GCM10017643_34530 [Ancylobacter dichloromethanicus]